MRRLYAHHALSEQYVRLSSLDWTIVRSGSFTKGARTGTYRHGFTAANSPANPKISRADVADLMLKQLTDDTYLHKAPCVS